MRPRISLAAQGAKSCVRNKFYLLILYLENQVVIILGEPYFAIKCLIAPLKLLSYPLQGENYKLTFILMRWVRLGLIFTSCGDVIANTITNNICFAAITDIFYTRFLKLLKYINDC